MRVTPLGVGDAFSALWYSSCLLVESHGCRILIDCPHPIRKILRESTTESPVDIDGIDAVVLTHLHGDHVSGLEGFAWFSFFALQRPVRLYAHPSVLAPLWEQHLAASMDRLLSADSGIRKLSFHELFDAIPLSLDQPVQAGPFAIRARMTRHHIPTTALRLATGEAELGYSADTSFDFALIAWLAEADLLIHETNLGAHTPYAALLELPLALRQRMRLIHYPDGFDPLSSEIPALIQGMSFEIKRA